MEDPGGKKKADPVHIASILNCALRAFNQQIDGELARVWRIWDEAVGETIAQNARPSAFKGRLLYVDVTSSPWLQQLHFLKNDVISMLNDALGGRVVEDIKFKIGT